MADDNSEPEVFEIEDFTTASEWERFIARLEDVISLWNLDNQNKNWNTKEALPSTKSLSREPDEIENETEKETKENTNKDNTITSHHDAEWIVKSEHILFADFSFTFSHHLLSSKNIDELHKKDENGTPGLPPRSVTEMFDIEYDFPPRAHCLARWYGLKEFLILSPSKPQEDINTESRSKLLLSSLAVAFSNTSCFIPGFVQVQQRWRRLFLGTCIGKSFATNFEMAQLRNPPQEARHLSGLLDIFKSKLAVPNRLIPPIMVSVRFTYILLWPEDEWVQEPPDFSTFFSSEVGHLRLSRLPFGPMQDPISELHLATTWPCLSEETIVDHPEYSDLKPAESPKWSLKARTAENCSSLLYDHVLSFVHICKNAESTAEIIRSLSKDELDIDTSGDITQAFSKLTETAPRFSHGPKSPLKNFKNREQMKLKESPLPEQLLNEILVHLFPDSHEDQKQAEERQRILAEEQQQIESENKKDKFRNLKSVPEKSLLILLTICLAIVNYGFGGVRAFAHLWHEFVLEMRFRYENNILIPRLAVCPPNLNYCLIHQKLQMLNQCILNKKRHYERSSRVDLVGSSKSTEKNNDQGIGDLSRDATVAKGSLWDVEDASSDSDDEFFEAVEEQEGNVVSDSSKPESQLNVQAIERCGVLTQTGMQLLETGEPLCIPITQEPPPMTEDMLEEQTEIIMKLGRSEDGSKYLAQMQSASLFSDVQAFKAANPGCIFEDFVRWYSPNDWIPGPETQKEKDELRKVETELRRLNEKAELTEVVGREEVDGWDLDADEELTDEDLANIIAMTAEENNEMSKWANEGHLSVRMRVPGNIWLQTWQTALAIPVRRQKRLFDDTKEAEKVLHFLANLNPSEIATQLFPVLVHVVINRLQLEPESCRCRISNILSLIIQEASRLRGSTNKDLSRPLNIARQVQIAELAIARIQFMEKRFANLGGYTNEADLDQEVKDFVSVLLSASEVTIEGGRRGKIGRIISNLIMLNQRQDRNYENESSKDSLSEIIREKNKTALIFPKPAGREYILRTNICKPNELSRECPQRIFAVVTPDEFRLAAAFTRDTTFL